MCLFVCKLTAAAVAVDDASRPNGEWQWQWQWELTILVLLSDDNNTFEHINTNDVAL